MQDTASPHVIPLDSSGLGDRSYIAHDGSAALVVDPLRDRPEIVEIASEWQEPRPLREHP
jgi:hypothetical protein